MLTTVLAQPIDDARGIAVQWRQLVDLIAQRLDVAASPTMERAYRILGITGKRVAVGDRLATARSLAGRRLPPRLVVMFANDHSSIAAPIMRDVRLGADEWIALLPALGPTARALLRHRDDLDPAVTRALEGFGVSDFVIEGDVGPPATVEPGQTQIRDLVARIEAFRRMRGDKSFVDAPDAKTSDSAGSR